MNKEQALNLIIQAVEVAQLKGAYTLKEAHSIAIAIELLKQTDHDTSKPTGDTTGTGDIAG